MITISTKSNVITLINVFANFDRKRLFQQYPP